MQDKKQQFNPDMEQETYIYMSYIYGIYYIYICNICQGGILSPCLFNLHAEYIKQNAELDEAQARIKIVGEILITSDMQMTPPLWQKVKRN